MMSNFHYFYLIIFIQYFLLLITYILILYILFIFYSISNFFFIYLLLLLFINPINLSSYSLLVVSLHSGYINIELNIILLHYLHLIIFILIFVLCLLRNNIHKMKISIVLCIDLYPSYLFSPLKLLNTVQAGYNAVYQLKAIMLTIDI